MSRREEVEAKLLHTAESYWPSADETAEYRHLSLTMADEVDAERAVVTKLLEMIKDVQGSYIGSTRTYARACEIAGRKI